jgi:hypothetical protein
VASELIQGLHALANRVVRQLNLHFGFTSDKSIEWYQYTLDLDGERDWTRGTERQGSIRITQESHFICTAVSAGMKLIQVDSSTLGRVGQVVMWPQAPGNNTYFQPELASGSFQYIITDGSSDRQKQNDWTEAHVGLGPGAMPTKLPRPMVLRANSNIQVRVRPNFGSQFSSQDEGEQVRISFVFHGYKLYKLEALDATARR